MPATQRHPAFRPILTVAILLAVVIFLAGLFYTSTTKRRAAQQQASAQQVSGEVGAGPEEGKEAGQGESASEAEGERGEPSGEEGSGEPERAPEPPVDEGVGAEEAVVIPAIDGPPLSAMGLRSRTYAPDAPEPAALGSLDPSSGKRSLVTFTLAGAGVQTITMADYFESVEQSVQARANPAGAEGHYKLQRDATVSYTYDVERDGQTVQETGEIAVKSLAARQIKIDGIAIDLFSFKDRRVWRETGPGRFEAEIIAGGSDTGVDEFPVARITRRYRLADDSFEIEVEQRVENLTGRALEIVWFQYGPVDLAEDPSGFRIPVRRVRFGHLLDVQRDPSRQIVEADDRLLTRRKLLDKMGPGMGFATKRLWPDAEEYEGADRAVWVAQTSRYFAFAVHPLIDRDEAAANLADPIANPIANKALELAEEVYAIRFGFGEDARVVLQMRSEAMRVAPGETAVLDFAAYAGPMSREALSKSNDPVYEAINLRSIVIFQIGWCGWCTFQPIARLLLVILNLFHSVVQDWALSIILLVLCVRGALHPIFKKSQISMMRFGKQMQRVQPKIKKLQEKYKGDPQKLREEQTRLMKEERVNYAGALGCLPMFMQTPIWIALYATLFFAFELRHQPAFYGLFQAISGNEWFFLADLSRPDNLVSFSKTYTIPGLSGLMGTFSGINILPLAWGGIFYIHQKYLSPPTTANMSPEQEQTQKIVKIMMVVMMPVFMYNAPSGLLVYFVTNSVLAIAEGRYIRSHVDKLDLDAPPKKPHQLGRKKVKSKATPVSPFGKKGSRGEGRDRFKKRS